MIGGLAAILVVVVGVGTILVGVGIGIVIYKRRQKRIRAFHAFAAQSQFSVVAEPKLDSFEDLSQYPIFRRGHSGTIRTLIQKPIDGGQLFIFDYVYTVRSGRSAKNHTTTVIAFHCPRLQLPYFTLYPESVLSIIGELVGWKDIDFVSHPTFSRRYKLSGEQEMHIRQVFSQHVLTSFESMPEVSVDGGGKYIFVYTPKQIIEIESLNRCIDNAISIYGLFRP